MSKIIEKMKINLYFIYSIGIIGFAFRQTRPVMKILTPIVLLITAVYVIIKSLYYLEKEKKNLFIIWSISVVFVTIFLEALGVKYGLFFGEYNYGSVLGPAVFGVPFIIGINWLIVIMGAGALIREYSDNIIIISLGAGFLAFLFDFILEPAAIALGFWQWEGSIPIKNYISWFSITFIFTYIACYLNINIQKKWSEELLKAQFIFFIVIRIYIFLNIL